MHYLEGGDGTWPSLASAVVFHVSETPTDKCLLFSSGVTFSFFWKTQGEQTQPAPYAYGGQVVSDGFKVCSSGGKGSVELYTRDNSMTWKATFNPPGECSTAPVPLVWDRASSVQQLKKVPGGQLSQGDLMPE